MTINELFWQSFSISSNDLDQIYNHLLEIEHPQNKFDLAKLIIKKTVSAQKEIIKADRLEGGQQYFPKNQYKIGTSVVFPQLDWRKGKVIELRPGRNPEFPEMEVVKLEFEGGENAEYAANLTHHILNQPLPEQGLELLDEEFVTNKYSQLISEKIDEALSSNEDLVCIAGSYFPRALLVDVGVGHLNLCEAVLEMANGGPLTTQDLLSQIELPTDVNANLTEFSLNLALQEDERFDEVGPAGETLWFLQRLEPSEVLTPPITIRYSGQPAGLPDSLSEYENFIYGLYDELEPEIRTGIEDDEVTISLTYPHWRAGTLPLTNQLIQLFPTAYETPRIKFNFRDGLNKDIYSGWVVRTGKYIYGLKDWYDKQGFIPGSVIKVRRSTAPGEVIVQSGKQRNSRDWIRTILVGTDGGVVFALLKQVVTSMIDDRMAVMVSDVAAVDALWSNVSRNKLPLEKVILNTMRELGKLNPQGQIHAQEIYACVNVSRRCPPSVILSTLFNEPWSIHLGDLYFKIQEGKV